MMIVTIYTYANNWLESVTLFRSAPFGAIKAQRVRHSIMPLRLSVLTVPLVVVSRKQWRRRMHFLVSV